MRWLACIGVKGDLPFLRKTGGLERHWQRAQRARDGKQPGVCWLCDAGTPHGGPFEDFNTNSKWKTLPVTEPWGQRPSVLDLYHSPAKPQDVFRPDMWRNFHGGAGKTFLGSALAEALRLLDGAKGARCEQLNEHLRSWVEKTGNIMPFSGEFKAERISLSSYQVLPEANWSEHNDTYIYCKFLQAFLEERETEVKEDGILCRVLDAVQSINRCFSILYTGGLWLERAESREAGAAGRRFLRRYAECADICMRARKLRFPVYVKFHMLDHSFRGMLERSDRYEWCINDLMDSVQMDEDFVGHCARISRGVSPVTTAFRVLQRYLVRAHQVWFPKK